MILIIILISQLPHFTFNPQQKNEWKRQKNEKRWIWLFATDIYLMQFWLFVTGTCILPFCSRRSFWRLLVAFSVFVFLDPPKPFGIRTTWQFQLFTKGEIFTGPCVGKKIQIVFIHSRSLKMKNKLMWWQKSLKHSPNHGTYEYKDGNSQLLLKRGQMFS